MNNSPWRVAIALVVLILVGCSVPESTSSIIPSATSVPILPEYTAGDSRTTEILRLIEVEGSKQTGTLSTVNAHNWLFDAMPGQNVHIQVSGLLDADLLATLIDPAGNVVATNDNSLGTKNPTIIAAISQSGLFTVRVAAATPGDYQIEIEDWDNPLPVWSAGDTNRATVAIYNARIGYSNPTSLASLDEAKNFLFSGNSGQTITIAASSSNADLQITLIGPSGQVIASDGVADGQPNATIITALTESGQYTVRVAALSFLEGASGQLDLNITPNS